MKLCMWNVIHKLVTTNDYLHFVNLKMVQIMQNNSEGNVKKATSVCKKCSTKPKVH